jgi:hypothetical protein
MPARTPPVRHSVVALPRTVRDAPRDVKKDLCHRHKSLGAFTRGDDLRVTHAAQTRAICNGKRFVIARD